MNPYTRDPNVPYVALDPADYFITTDSRRDGFPDVQIREVIKVTRGYRGYGQRMKVSGRTGERLAKFVPLDPDEIPMKVKARLDNP